MSAKLAPSLPLPAGVTHPLSPFLLRIRLFVVCIILASVVLLAREFVTPPLIAAALNPKVLRAYTANRISPPPLTGTWSIPPNMSMHGPVVRDSQYDAEMKAHDWTQPRVLTMYARVAPSNDTDLFVYATGVIMGNFNQRNLSVFGCVVGKDVYPLAYSDSMDVFMCTLPASRQFTKSDRVSLAIKRNAALDRAMSAPVELTQGVLVNLTRGVDILDLPDGVTVHSATASGSLVQIPSNVSARNTSAMEGNWRVSVETNQSRYEICGVTMMKQFPNLLDDWIAYNRRIGVDMLYILDNAAIENLSEKYAHRTDVDVIYWPFQRSQVQAMSLFAVSARIRCEWLIGFDADEYILLGIGKSHEDANTRILKRYLTRMRHDGYDDVRFKYVTMGPSANVRIPTTPVPEAYIAKWGSQKLNVKSASQTSRDWLVSKIHYQKGRLYAKTRRTSKVNDRPVTLEDGPALIHYQFRSLEESMLKKKFGSSSIGDKNLDDGSNTEKRSLDNPGPGYSEIPEHLKYTFFRDVWRSITRATTVDSQTLVMWDGHLRCRVEYRHDARRFSNEHCMSAKVAML